jgi:hypothetical protein
MNELYAEFGCVSTDTDSKWPAAAKHNISFCLIRTGRAEGYMVLNDITAKSFCIRYRLDMCGEDAWIWTT